MSTNRAPRLCGPDCRYRALYEGSQASLSDMAAKQASALNRVARLRDGMILSLKQAFPELFAEAEVRLGRRMSSCDDEIVLAYLSGFLAGRPAADLSPLRMVLAAAGIAVPVTDDVATLAAAVGSALAAARAGVPAHAAAPAVSPAPVLAPPAPVAPVVAVAQPGEDDLFGPPGDVIADPGDLWDGVFADEAAGEAPGAGPVDDGEFAIGDDDDPLRSLFEDETPAPPTAPVISPPSPAAGTSTGSADAAAGQPSTGASSAGEPPAPVAEPSQTAAQTPAQTPAPGPLAPRRPLTARPGTRADTPRADTPQTDSPQPEPAPSPAAQTPAGRPSAGDDVVVRPALFPTAPGRPAKAPAKKAPRKPRTTAARPDPASLDVPIVQGHAGELGDDLYNQLISAVCIPRPVFTSDLARIAGCSAELVDAWEQRCKAEHGDSPVRFIGAKQRHRARGDLVIPFAPELRAAASEFTASWWAQCIDNRNMRGAKLYETAVLLHRFGEQVISNRIDEDATVLTLRLNQGRGLVGVVMLLDQRLGAGETARARLTEAIEELLSDRLSLIAVLTTTAGPSALEKLSETVREEADERGWSRATPVIAAHSWDFASDGGSSAVQVLG